MMPTRPNLAFGATPTGAVDQAGAIGELVTSGASSSLGAGSALARTSTRLTQHVNASRSDVYRALLDPSAVATWMVPSGMTSQVHAFDAREGGAFRISLSYDSPTGAGKTSAHTDTYHGRFTRLIPNEQVIQVMEFETGNPAMRGEMIVTYALIQASGGTDVLAVHDKLPPGLSAVDNEKGWRMALEKLARWVEAGRDNDA